jgi:PAS domain S-box-containing protein
MADNKDYQNPGHHDPDVTGLTDDEGGKQDYTEQHPLVRASLLEILCHSIPASQFTIAAGALISVFVFYGYTPAQVLFSWLSIVAGISAVRIYLAHNFLQRSVNLDDLERFHLIFNGWTAAMGLSLAAGAIFLPPPDSTLLVGFSIMILFAIGSSAVVGLAAVPNTFIIFILCCYGPPAFWLIAARSYEQQILAVLLIIYIGLTFIITRHQRQTFLYNILLRLQNETLVKRLREDAMAKLHIRNQLEESEQRLRDLFENASDLIFVIYVDGTFAFVNRKFLKILGYSETEVMKLKISDVVHPDQLDAFRKSQELLLSTPELTIESILVCKDGSLINVEGTLNSVVKFGRPYQIRVFYRDITQRKQAELALQAAQSKYQNIVDNALDIIFTTDMQGHLTFVNKVSSEITGYSMDELTGMNYLRLVYPDYRKATGKFFAAHLRNKTPNSRYLSPILTRNNEIKWIEQFTQILFENGQPVGFQGVARDVTDRIKIEEELRRARDEAEAGKEAEEQFIACVSHEIRTPMNAVVGFIDLISKTRLDQSQQEYLWSLKHSSDRLLKIVNDLLEFKRIQAGKIEFINAPFSLANVLKQQISIFSNQANSKGIDLRYNIDPSIPDALLGDDARLSQILQNLISNSIKYTEQGHVHVGVTRVNSVSGNVQLRFTVSDTGAGIPKDKLPDIFDTYQQVDTKRDSFIGSGLGLAIFKNLVELQGGSIEVESTPGSGSTFSFILNFTLDQQSGWQEVEADTGQLLHNLGPISLLLVDDDAMNIYVALKFLEEFDNINVTTADDGKKALNEFRQHDYDIIMTDINMPVMDGYELTQHIREDFAKPKSDTIIVALTAELTPQEKLRLAGIDYYLMKPFTRDALYKKMHESLTRNRQN